MALKAKHRLWIAGVLAAIALVLAGIAALVPFMDAPPGGVAGSLATLLIVAEVFAALAILVVGREIYGKIMAKLQAMRAELSEQTSRGENNE
jgi:membrane protease YdiL (CAAX protease family)